MQTALIQDIVVHQFQQYQEWQEQEIYREKKNSCIAVIGDGALTGGMALEALNDAGCSNCNLTVILNDNEMSIAKIQVG